MLFLQFWDLNGDALSSGSASSMPSFLSARSSVHLAGILRWVLMIVIDFTAASDCQKQNPVEQTIYICYIYIYIYIYILYIYI